VVTEHHPPKVLSGSSCSPSRICSAAAAKAARAIRAIGLPRSLDDLQLAVGNVLENKPRGPGPTPIVRVVLESDFLPGRALVEGAGYMVGRGADNAIVRRRCSRGSSPADPSPSTRQPYDHDLQQ